MPSASDNLELEEGAKAHLLASLNETRAKLLAAVSLVPDTERESRPVCGHWTLKDLLGHIADWEAFGASYPTYVAETKAVLNDLGPLDFAPDFILMDGVVASLRVEPDVELVGAETVAAPDEYLPIAPTGIYQVYDSDNGLYRLCRAEMDGSSEQLTEQRYGLLPAPDAAHAVYMDDDRRL